MRRRGEFQASPERRRKDRRRQTAPRAWDIRGDRQPLRRAIVGESFEGVEKVPVGCRVQSGNRRRLDRPGAVHSKSVGSLPGGSQQIGANTVETLQ